jgi:hypothetical protein
LSPSIRSIFTTAFLFAVTGIDTAGQKLQGPPDRLFSGSSQRRSIPQVPLLIYNTLGFGTTYQARIAFTVSLDAVIKHKTTIGLGVDGCNVNTLAPLPPDYHSRGLFSRSGNMDFLLIIRLAVGRNYSNARNSIRFRLEGGAGAMVEDRITGYIPVVPDPGFEDYWGPNYTQVRETNILPGVYIGARVEFPLTVIWGPGFGIGVISCGQRTAGFLQYQRYIGYVRPVKRLNS